MAFETFVDYREHPAFKIHSSAQNRSFEGIEIFKKIDSHLESLHKNSSGSGLEKVAKEFDELIRPEISMLSSMIVDQMSGSDMMKPVALQALANLFEVLKKEVRFRNARHNYRPSKGVSGTHHDMVSELAINGFFNRTIDENLLARLWTEIEEWRNILSEKRKMRPETMASCVIPLPQEGRKWKTINQILDQIGLRDVVNDATQFPMDLDYAALQLSHEDERWWKNCYEDVGLPTGPGAYLHYDEDFALVKAILYLKPVELENGPFSIIPAHSLTPPPYSREAFFKRMDTLTQPLFLNDPEAKFCYYRKHFKLPKFRKEFARLPPVLQGTSHFGDDLLDGSKQTEELLIKERKVTSDVGNFTVFRGGSTLHRGGMVEKGERWAIQFGFRMRDSSWSGVHRRIKGELKAQLPESLVKAIRATKSKFKS